MNRDPKYNSRFGEVTRAQFERLEYQSLRKKYRERLAGWVFVFILVSCAMFVAGIYFARTHQLESFWTPPTEVRGKKK